jgi:hypothetical protein
MTEESRDLGTAESYASSTSTPSLSLSRSFLLPKPLSDGCGSCSPVPVVGAAEEASLALAPAPAADIICFHFRAFSKILIPATEPGRDKRGREIEGSGEVSTAAMGGGGSRAAYPSSSRHQGSDSHSTLPTRSIHRLVCLVLRL